MNQVNIVLFWFNDDWGVFGRAYERVAEGLARMEEISHVVCVFPSSGGFSENSRISVSSRTVSEKLTLATEVVRKERQSWLSRLVGKASISPLGSALRDHLRSKGFTRENTILWLFPPHPYLDVVRTIVPHCGIVAHVIDDFTKFDPKHELYGYAKSQYPAVCKWADLIITTSKANKDKFSLTGKPCYIFGPAVDEIFFATPSELPHRGGVQPPRLGYVGWIMDRTDLDLIAFLARSRPHWRISLVGPEYPEGIVSNSGLVGVPNVEWRGSIPQDQVPAYLQELDVCLIPHRDNEYSRSMGPLKLYQYLASGRPVVSTNVAGLEDVRRHVFVANDYEDFVRGVESSLETDTPARALQRIEFARLNTWDVRVGEMFEVVRSGILNKDLCT